MSRNTLATATSRKTRGRARSNVVSMPRYRRCRPTETGRVPASPAVEIWLMPIRLYAVWLDALAALYGPPRRAEVIRFPRAPRR